MAKQTDRRTFLKQAATGMLTLSLSAILPRCYKKQRPNIIFIMSDDHAYQAISCYDNTFINTPNIDRIANEGIRFKNAFVTNSICAPSRAALLTGKYSHTIGFRDNLEYFDGKQQTFPKLLQRVGYQTALIGKWHLKTIPTGFDIWKVLQGQGQYYNPTICDPHKKKNVEGYVTDVITDLALETLDQLDPGRPFCMLVHHKAPHRNWMPNIKYLGAFDDKEIPMPDTFFDDYNTRSDAAKSADMRVVNMYLSHDFKLQPGYYEKETGTGGSKGFAAHIEKSWKNTYERLNEEQRKAWDAYYNKVNEEFKRSRLSGRKLAEWKYQRYMKDYLSCVLSVDESVGRILDYLDQKGLAENTVVVYTSDQGFYLGEHGWYDKRFMYEESLGMPLLMRYPAEVPAGKVSEAMVLNIDYAPTFLDYGGVRIPADIQGRSFRPVANGHTPPDWRKSMYYHYYEYPQGWHLVKRHYGIRTERYKLIHFYNDINKWELYDLQNDPHELNNVIEDSAYANVLKELKEELKRLQYHYNDPIGYRLADLYEKDN